MDVNRLRERAVERFRQGNFSAAHAYADQIIAQHPEVALSWRFKGECLFEMSRHDEAIVAFERAASLGGPGTDELVFWIALCHNNAHRFAEARQVLLDLIAQARPEQSHLVERARHALERIEQYASSLP